MIEPERVLMVLEAISGDEMVPKEPAEVQKFYSMVYQLAHVGNSHLHTCDHPAWEDEFLILEAKLVEGNAIPDYKTLIGDIESGERKKRMKELKSLLN